VTRRPPATATAFAIRLPRGPLSQRRRQMDGQTRVPEPALGLLTPAAGCLPISAQLTRFLSAACHPARRDDEPSVVGFEEWVAARVGAVLPFGRAAKRAWHIQTNSARMLLNRRQPCARTLPASDVKGFPWGASSGAPATRPSPARPGRARAARKDPSTMVTTSYGHVRA
jgi:hypothetical protein